MTEYCFLEPNLWRAITCKTYKKNDRNYKTIVEEIKIKTKP